MEAKFRIRNSTTGEIVAYEQIVGSGWFWKYSDAPEWIPGTFTKDRLGDGFLGSLIREMFIGITVKNGVEIYEDDLVKSGSEVFQIQYHGASFSLINSAGEWDGYLMVQGSDRIEVIGNIHQHPELLKE